VLEEAVDGRIELLVPELVLDELVRVLMGKLAFAAERAAAAHAALVELATVVPASAEVATVTGDPADDAVLAAAVEAGADVLVTGDRSHLLPLGEHTGVRILPAQALLAELRVGEPAS
jgi:predicted nucleic acid-binding protein